MDATIWQTIAETPWWGHVFLGFLIWVSWTATKPSIVPVKYIYLYPFFLLLCILPGLILWFPFSLLNSSLSLAAICLGIPFGWLQFKTRKIKAIKNKNQLYIPGSWNLILLFLLFCLLKFYFDFEISNFFTPKVFTYPKIALGIICFYGFSIGFLLGCAWYAKQCIKTGPFVSESP